VQLPGYHKNRLAHLRRVFCFPVKERHTMTGIREAMEKRGVTHDELARRLGRNVRGVYDLTRTSRDPRASSIVRVAEALRCEPAELLPQVDPANAR
jgi:transcriptional regulator with XRE-family HTH domain